MEGVMDAAKPTTLPNFNPSNDARVTEIKGLTEQLLTYIGVLRDNGDIDPRLAATALTYYEIAAMLAVKSLFVKP
jgi:hypothetical protein